MASELRYTCSQKVETLYTLLDLAECIDYKKDAKTQEKIERIKGIVSDEIGQYGSLLHECKFFEKDLETRTIAVVIPNKAQAS